MHGFRAKSTGRSSRSASCSRPGILPLRMLQTKFASRRKRVDDCFKNTVAPFDCTSVPGMRKSGCFSRLKKRDREQK
jgi:hypothetical protein